MKKYTLASFVVLGILTSLSSCNKRVDCLCVATPVEPREGLDVTEFYVTFPDGGDCDDASGPFYHEVGFQREEPYIAVCEEIPQELMNPDELNGEGDPGVE